MPAHIRNKPQQEQQMNGSMPSMMPPAPANKPSSIMQKGMHIMQRIRSSPRQMIGWILFFIFIAIAIAAGGHYMRYWTLPKVSFIPQKPAPASHLQYFFF